MADWSVRKRGEFYEVIKPDGTVRCRLLDGAFAYQVANELRSDWLGTPHPVRCVETGVVYEDCTQASRKTGCSREGIKKCCRGVLATSGGYTWEYVYAK